MAREQPALAQLYWQISEMAPASFREEVRFDPRAAQAAPACSRSCRCRCSSSPATKTGCFRPRRGRRSAGSHPRKRGPGSPAGHSVYFERAAQFNDLIGRIV